MQFLWVKNPGRALLGPLALSQGYSHLKAQLGRICIQLTPGIDGRIQFLADYWLESVPPELLAGGLHSFFAL